MGATLVESGFRTISPRLLIVEPLKVFARGIVDEIARVSPLPNLAKDLHDEQFFADTSTSTTAVWKCCAFLYAAIPTILPLTPVPVLNPIFVPSAAD